MVALLAALAWAQEGTPPVTATGVLDRAEIDVVIKEGLRDVRDCYAVRLGEDPVLAGRVLITFTIAVDGSVSESAVESSTLPDPAVGTCIAELFRSYTFPEPRGGGVVTVSYPFVFSPGFGDLLPKKAREPVSACLADLVPIPGYRLSVAIHSRWGRLDAMRVLYSTTDPGDRTACLTPPLEKYAVGIDSWRIFALPEPKS